MAIIDSLKDKLGSIIYPKTVTKAVYDATTSERLDSIIDELRSSVGSGSGTGSDGLSAYQIAVKNGFVGTEEEWLASLVGVGVPLGGTVGQVLSKVDDIDFNTQWADAIGGGSNPPSFLDLPETPSSFEGQSKKVLAVNDAEDGMEFSDVDAVKLQTKSIDIKDFAGKDGYVLAYDEALDAFCLKKDEPTGGGGKGSFFTKMDSPVVGCKDMLIPFTPVTVDLPI